MKKPGTMLARILFITYVAVLFGIIVPAHGHEDLLDRHHCMLCQLSSMIAPLVAAFILTIIPGAMTSIATMYGPLTVPSFKIACPTRAPPRS